MQRLSSVYILHLSKNSLFCIIIMHLFWLIKLIIFMIRLQSTELVLRFVYSFQVGYLFLFRTTLRYGFGS